MDELLAGGNMNAVRRVGDAVVRTAGPWTPTIHRYLHALRATGIDWIPGVLARDETTETLSYIHGDVPVYPLPEWVWADDALAQAARRLRALHDASAGFSIVGAVWQSPSHEPAEVICHNDFAPHNLAFRDGGVVGVIDFDMASPGPRIWDLAYLATRMVPLTTERHPGACSEDEWPRRLRLMLDSYGGDQSAAAVVRVAIVRLIDLARFSRDKSEQLGEPELLDHAALYDRAAAYLELWRERTQLDY